MIGKPEKGDEQKGAQHEKSGAPSVAALPDP